MDIGAANFQFAYFLVIIPEGALCVEHGVHEAAKTPYIAAETVREANHDFRSDIACRTDLKICCISLTCKFYRTAKVPYAQDSILCVV